MDFFSSHHDSQFSSTTAATTTDSFAQEIGRRFSQPILTARLSPVITAQSPGAPSSSSTTTTTTTIPTYAALASPQAKLNALSLRSKPPTPAPLDSRISTVDPVSLSNVLKTPHILILDIRPHATFMQSRLFNALSLSVPSTLLKRPAFPLDKLTEMLSSASARRKFSTWKSASRILVYDADSQMIPDGSNIRGLLRKFDNEGFRGELSWLKGGFAAVWREHRQLVNSGPPSPDSSEEEDSTLGYLRTRKLPSSAFQQSSTTSASQRPPHASTSQANSTVAPPPMSTRTVAANPFYDNIRQNRELEHGITERIPLKLPPEVRARRDDLPFDWLKQIVDKADVEEGTESLAMQFYMIELREQRRLMGVMDHHSKEASHTSQKVSFPYSITAGVEKGTKNRYQNIWPFEHARVRLKSSSLEDGSDYINASHVHPLGTRRRYIATQGPLPTTYIDFWTLCWEQNINIIVMLTKQVEGALEKCGCYWRQNMYGPFRLELVSSTGDEEIEVRTAPPNLGFNFGGPSSSSQSHSNPPVDTVVRRTFMLSHVNHPEIPPRKVTQFQYLGWPDYDVPEDPKGLLGLMRQVDALRAEHGNGSPVLLHCSAGIGRTGGFIMVDAALDGIRHELQKRRQTTTHEEMGIEASEDMDLDPISRDATLRRIGMSSPRRSRGGNGQDAALYTHPESSNSTYAAHRGFMSPSMVHGGGLVPSVLNNNINLHMPKATSPLRKSFLTLFGEPDSKAGSSSNCNIHTPSSSLVADSSVASMSINSALFSSPGLNSRSTGATSSIPVSVESSRSTSPFKQPAQLTQGVQTSFDYTDPRNIADASTPTLLSHFNEPVRSILEDMREQRMSLCQSLRQYVFVHRAIVEGALEIVDQERSENVDVGTQISGYGWHDEHEDETMLKRGPSPTELLPVDKRGGERLMKRPSFRRRERSDVSSTTECGPAAQ